MKILFIGDIFGHEGRRACLNEIKKLKEEKKIDLVIANAENTSNGKERLTTILPRTPLPIQSGRRRWPILSPIADRAFPDDAKLGG